MRSTGTSNLRGAGLGDLSIYKIVPSFAERQHSFLKARAIASPLARYRRSRVPEEACRACGLMRRCGRHPQHGAEKTAAAATALLLVLLYVTIEGQPTASGQTYAGQNIIPLSPGELTMYNWEAVEEGGEAALESYCDERGVQVRAVFGLGLYSVDQLFILSHTPSLTRAATHDRAASSESFWPM